MCDKCRLFPFIECVYKHINCLLAAKVNLLSCARTKVVVCATSITFAMLPVANAFPGTSAHVRSTKSSAIRPFGAVKIKIRAAICRPFAMRFFAYIQRICRITTRRNTHC